MKKQQFSMRIQVTPENREFIEFYQQWSAAIPTLFFLDLCTISHIKDSLKRDPDDTSAEPPSLAALRLNDLPQNGISYLPALMEKASDTDSNFSVEGLIEEVGRDLNAMRRFFKHARLVESMELASTYVTDLKGVHPEILGPSYHEFLNLVNGLQIFNKITASKRIKTVKAICDQAASLGIHTGHPLVLASLACIYSCVAAKKVLKFKKNPNEFSSSNALGDIQIIQRVGKLSQLIEEKGRKTPGSYLRTQFVTDDTHLKDFYKYFLINDVISEENGDSTTTTYKITVKADQLFPDLFNEDGSVKGDAENEELLKIYAFVGVPVDAAPITNLS